ncbi:MAG: hypothetical protein M0R28_20360 [Pigmentiphaga sp.]|nr:hypothetical protein [Pigmentiphaga sp.]
MHEAEDFEVQTFLVEEGRFSADVIFAAYPAPELVDDLSAAGFNFGWDPAGAPAEMADTAVDPAPEITEIETLTEGPVEDMTAAEIPAAGGLADKLDVRGVEPKAPRKPAYVAETSTVEGPTKRVWAIADSMTGATRKQVIDACREAGIAFGTARTQYQKWFTANKVG